MANLPALRYCLIAEQLRPEANNKMTVLGFFGISPLVRIMVASIPVPLNVATLFLLEEAEVSGSLPIEVSVTGPDGDILSITRAPEAVKMEKSKGVSLALTFQSLPIKSSGKVSINVYTDSGKQFDASFEISVLPPEIVH